MQNIIDQKIHFPKGYNYRPLPFGLFIGESHIEGQGLFTKNEIRQNKNLGISHIKIKDEFIRLPLGGFINHSNIPNCKLSILENPKTEMQNFYLVSIQNINQNEELTLDYNISANTTKIHWSDLLI